MKPTSGGGIHAARFAADFVAREARPACAPATSPSRRLRAYETACWSSLGHEMRRGYDLRRVFERLTPSLPERLFGARGAHAAPLDD